MRSWIDRFMHAWKSELSFFLAVPAVIWLVVFLGAPVLLLVGSSLRDGLGIFSTDSYRMVFDYAHGALIAKSAAVALFVATMCLIIGYPIAYYSAVRMRRYKNFFLFFLTIPFWTNFLVQAYAWFFVLGKEGVLNTVLMKIGIIKAPLSMLYTPYAVIMVMVYCYVPFMIMPLYGVLEKLDVSLIEASLDLGAGQFQTFTRVVLPLTMPGVRTGFFMVFIPAFGEYAIPAVLGGGKFTSVGTMITTYFLEAHNPELGAAFTVLSSFMVLVTGFIVYWVALRSRRAEHRHE